MKPIHSIILSLFLLTVSFNPLNAQQLYDESNYYRVSIPVNQQEIIDKMHMRGLAIDHVVVQDETMFAELNGYELNILLEEKIDFEVLIQDLETWYREKLVSDPVFLGKAPLGEDVPENFTLGSMGGHLTLDEVNEQMDLMYEKFPGLITEKFSIGQSYEDREIYTVWIGKDFDEDKPQAYYNSLIHAREPMSMMNLVYYMWWLLENYDEDDMASFLIDERHMAFTLVLNPDGYEYNRENEPNGGGMHRKNRRPVGWSNQGIDLNRNFGPLDFWDHPNGGSSTDPNSHTYRGAEPFSEPETTALKEFVEDNDFRTSFNYHNFSNLLIYPYGALQRETADAHVFTPYAIDMTAENNYEYGTDIQTVGYNTRGAADDWFYGFEYSNPDKRMNIISMTPEVGGISDGTGGAAGAFWARAERIVPLSQDNLLANQLLALYAGPEIRFPESDQPEISTELIPLSGATTINLSFENSPIYNYGRTNMEAKLVLSSESDYLIIHEGEAEIPIQFDKTFAGVSESFIIEADEFTENGQEINITLSLSAPYMRDEFEWEFTLVADQNAVSIDRGNEIVSVPVIYDNYPNPFNPSTNIRFALPEQMNIQLDVFDSLGRKVANLVDGSMGSGDHNVSFDASSLSSGIYIYRLNAEGFVQSGTMTLIK